MEIETTTLDPLINQTIYNTAANLRHTLNNNSRHDENLRLLIEKENLENANNYTRTQTLSPQASSPKSFAGSSLSSHSPSSSTPKFLHDDPRFKSLIKLCAEERGIDPSCVEKDYYITHALWCLRKRGLEIQIKGGVSLAKGFGVLNRLSEDVDAMLRPNASSSAFLQEIITELSEIDMKSKLKTGKRAQLWNRFANGVKKSLTGFDVEIAKKGNPFYDPRWTYLVLQAYYEPSFPILDEQLTKPEVVIEISMSIDEPLDPIPMRLSSFLHVYLEQKHMLHQFKRNIPTVLCTHPMITLLQKISDGIVNRYQRPIEEGVMVPFASGLRGKIPPFDPRIVRHYEDAASMIQNISKCFPLRSPAEFKQLYVQLMERRMVRRKPESGTTIHDDESLLLLEKDKLKIEALTICQQQRLCLHYSRIRSASPPTLEECASVIREWLMSVEL